MVALSVAHVSKRFGDGTRALSDVTLEVSDGELLSIVGPSGCGKSTLLRIIAGLEQPTSGIVRLGDRDVTAVEPGRRNVAMVFQGGANLPHLTVAQNLGFGLRIRRTPKKVAAARVQEVADLLGLGDLMDRLPAELSGGENQRVAIGRAMVRDPLLLLMDESLSNLDAHLRLELRREIARLQRTAGITTLFVTHDQEEALSLGRRTAVMRAGTIEQVDVSQVLYDRPATAFVASFVGTPPMNLVSVDVSSGVVLTGGQPQPYAASREDGSWTVGLRPEDLRVSDTVGVDDWVFRVCVELVEHLGREVHVTSTVVGGAGSLVVRMERSRAPEVGQQLTLTAPTGCLHWFPREL